MFRECTGMFVKFNTFFSCPAITRIDIEIFNSLKEFLIQLRNSVSAMEMVKR